MFNNNDIWSKELIVNTLKCIYEEMLLCTKARKLHTKLKKKSEKYKRKLSNNQKLCEIRDIDFDIIYYSNLIELLKIVDHSNNILCRYITKFECLSNDLMSCSDYILNICKFLDEENKIILSSTNNTIRNIIINSELCPIYYKLDHSNFLINNILNNNDVVEFIINKKKIFQKKIMSMENILNKNCKCQIKENYYNLPIYYYRYPITKICNSCKLLHINNNIRYVPYSSPFKESYYEYLNKIIIIKFAPEKKDKVKENLDSCFNKLFSIICETESMSKALLSIYREKIINNFIIGSYEQIIIKYKQNYDEVLKRYHLAESDFEKNVYKILNKVDEKLKIKNYQDKMNRIYTKSTIYIKNQFRYSHNSNFGLR